MSDPLLSSEIATPQIRAVDIRRSFRIAGRQIEVLKGVSLEIRAGECAFLVGASGAGNTTLLYTLAGMERPESGRVEFQGRSLYDQSDNLRLVLPDTLSAAPPRKRQPVAKAPPLTIEAEPLYDVELFELLRARRMEFAKEHNLMPVYRVFPDATLKAFARLLPTTEEAAVRINGVSESKAREYFPAFLPILLAAKKGGQ